MNKPYSIKFVGKPDFLYAKVTGNAYNYEICKQHWTEVFDEARKLGYKKVLVHENIREALTMEEIYMINQELDEIGFPDFIVAFVDEVPGQHDINRFGEVMTQAAGINAKIFGSVEDAERWLAIV